MLEKSRAEYFRRRREAYRQFVVMVERERLDAFDTRLKARGITRAQWLREKIDVELEGEL